MRKLQKHKKSEIIKIKIFVTDDLFVIINFSQKCDNESG